ncbi:MAG: FapA family protein [Bacillota bacterium]|nr:FapA family protein [Bacillota bacterium]
MENVAKNIIRVDLSNDYYTAYLTIEREDGAPSVKEGDVLDALKEKSVVFGIDFNAVKKVIELQSVMEYPVAEGIRHENGSDAELDYKFPIGEKAKPELLEDGTVNFKNLGIVRSVSKDGVLVEKKPATKAKPGTTVTGRNIQGRDGKDKVLAQGKNTRISEDGLRLISDIDGSIAFDGRTVSVETVMEIKGDIGIATGNLSFIGNIVVNGNICDGYEVTTTGDLTVTGVVEGAVLDVGGNLMISRGIKGHNSSDIKVKGNLITGFINSADLKVKGDIEANTVMSSKIRCDGSIKLNGKKGQLMGGETLCKGHFEAKVIGSDLEVVTDIKLGLDADLVDEIKNLAVDIKDSGDTLDKLGKDLQTIVTKLKLNPENEKLKLLLSKTKKEYDETENGLKTRRSRLNMLQELANSYMASRLKAGHIFPGVRVKIGNSMYLVKHQMQNVILKREKNEVVAIGY